LKRPKISLPFKNKVDGKTTPIKKITYDNEESEGNCFYRRLKTQEYCYGLDVEEQ